MPVLAAHWDVQPFAGRMTFAVHGRRWGKWCWGARLESWSRKAVEEISDIGEVQFVVWTNQSGPHRWSQLLPGEVVEQLAPRVNPVATIRGWPELASDEVSRVLGGMSGCTSVCLAGICGAISWDAVADAGLPPDSLECLRPEYPDKRCLPSARPRFWGWFLPTSNSSGAPCTDPTSDVPESAAHA